MSQIKFSPKKAFSGAAESIRKIQLYGRTSAAEARYIRVMALLMMVIAVILGAVLSSARISAEFKDNDRTLKISIETLKQRVTFSDQILSEEESVLDDYVRNEAAMTRLHLENTPQSEWQDALNVLVVEGDNAEFYYVRDGREVYKSSNAEGLGLTETLLKKLTDSGLLSVSDDESDDLYAASPLAGGYVVAMYRDIGSFTGIELRDHLDDSSVDIEDSGIIIYDKDSGRMYSDGGEILTERSIYDSDIKPLFDNSDDIDVCDTDYNLLELLCSADKYRIYSADLEDGIRATAYYSLRNKAVSALSDVLLPVAYVLLAAIVLVISASVLRMVRSAARAETEVIRIGRRLALDKLIIRRELSLFSIVAVIVTLILIYVSMLADISRQNLEALENLDRIAVSESSALDFINHFKDIRNEFTTGELDKAVMLIEADEDLRSDSALRTVAGNLRGCTDITIYDGDGISVASANGYIGYPIEDYGSSDEQTGQSYDYLSRDAFLTEPDDNDISFYTVKCRYNSGFIRFTVINDMFKDILTSMGGDAILLEADFGNADVMYYYAAKPDVLYVAKAGEHKVTSISNELGPDVLHDKYFGIHLIGGTRYLLNVAADPNNEGNFFADALDFKYIFR